MTHHQHPHQPDSGRTASRRIDNRDLFAWVDGQIASGSALDREIRAHLETHPELRVRVAAWQAQNQAIQQHYAPTLAEAVPEHLEPAAIRARRAGKRHGAVQRRVQFAMAAGVAGIAVVLAMNWTGPAADDPLQDFARDVSRLGDDQISARFAAMPAEGSDLLSDAALPDFALAGFRPAEQRQLMEQSGPVMEIRYEGKHGESMTLFMAREPMAEPGEVREIAPDNDASGKSLVYWRQDGWMYALSGDVVASDQLRELAVATLRGDRRQQFAASARPGDDSEPVASAEAPTRGTLPAEGSASAEHDAYVAPQPDAATPVMHQFEEASF